MYFYIISTSNCLEFSLRCTLIHWNKINEKNRNQITEKNPKKAHLRNKGNGLLVREKSKSIYILGSRMEIHRHTHYTSVIPIAANLLTKWPMSLNFICYSRYLQILSIYITCQNISWISLRTLYSQWFMTRNDSLLLMNIKNRKELFLPPKQFCLSVCSACISLYIHVLQWPEEHVGSPGTWLTGSCKLLYGCWKLNLVFCKISKHWVISPLQKCGHVKLLLANFLLTILVRLRLEFCAIV